MVNQPRMVSTAAECEYKEVRRLALYLQQLPAQYPLL